MTGIDTQGKPINLAQLQAEVGAAGVQVDALGMLDTFVFAYDADGQPVDFPAASQSTVEQAIAQHVALRDKTDAEYAAEFQTAGTTAARKQEIRDQQSGLLPREQVPM